MTSITWNADEIEKTIRALRTAEVSAGNPLAEPVPTVSAAQFRSMAGTLRGGSSGVIVKYRQKPACLAIPHPVHFWQDSRPFVARLIGGRNRFLVPPYCEPAHPWANQTTRIETGTMEQLRRHSAQVYAHILRNTAYVLTYYDQYEAMSLIPTAPGMPDSLTQLLARIANAFIRLPPEEHADALREAGLQAPLSDLAKEEIEE